MGYYSDLDEDRYADFEAARDEQAFLRERVSPGEYSIAKIAKAETRVVCAGCGNGFLKRSYQQAFCRNKGPGNCKDIYWNTVAPRGLKAGIV